jgi:hypothetical protein
MITSLIGIRLDSTDRVRKNQKIPKAMRRRQDEDKTDLGLD